MTPPAFTFGGRILQHQRGGDNGEEQPLILREDATMLSVPQASWDDLAGLDLHGKIAVYVNAMAPFDASDNVKSHVGSAGERWAVLKKAGAIGIATLPNPRPPAGTPAEAADAAGAARGNALPAQRGAGAGRGGAQTFQTTIVLADRDLQDQDGQIVSVMLTRRGAEKLLDGSGHTLDELDGLIADKKALPRFLLPVTLRAQAAVKRTPVGSENIIGIYDGSDPGLRGEFVVISALKRSY